MAYTNTPGAFSYTLRAPDLDLAYNNEANVLTRLTELDYRTNT